MNNYFSLHDFSSTYSFTTCCVVGLILQIQCNRSPPHQLPLPSVNPPLSPPLHYNHRLQLPRIQLFHQTDTEISPLPWCLRATWVVLRMTHTVTRTSLRINRGIPLPIKWWEGDPHPISMEDIPLSIRTSQTRDRPWWTTWIVACTTRPIRGFQTSTPIKVRYQSTECSVRIPWGHLQA